MPMIQRLNTAKNKLNDKRIDWKLLMEPVARELWGTPNPIHPTDGSYPSSRTELRWGHKGSRKVTINPKEEGFGAFFDHEADKGGGVLKLIFVQRGLGKDAALKWLVEKRLIDEELAPTNSNGNAPATTRTLPPTELGTIR